MLVQKGAISLKPVELTAHRRLWGTSCSSLGCTHSSGYQTWQRATGAGGSTWEPHLCLCCITTAAKPSSGSKHTAKVNFSTPALCSETMQNPAVLGICFPASKPGSHCARCIQAEDKSMLEPKNLFQGLLDHTLTLLQPFQTNDISMLHPRITL